MALLNVFQRQALRVDHSTRLQEMNRYTSLKVFNLLALKLRFSSLTVSNSFY